MKVLPRAELVLPVVIVLAAVLVGVSEFLTTFQFTPDGGDPLRSQLASDRHGYALLLLAIMSLIAMVAALVTGTRPPAIAAAVFGCTVLLIFLIVDLPDAGRVGDLEDPVFGLASARAEPQPGFWLEAIGSVVLGLSTLAFATLRPYQLRAPLAWLTARRAPEDPRPAHPPRR